jgi:hypothetical protein
MMDGDGAGGSLRSLNHLAAALALRLWEEFVAERVGGSAGLHAEFDQAGRLGVTSPAFPGLSCRLCPLLGLWQEGVLSGRGLWHPEPSS